LLLPLHGGVVTYSLHPRATAGALPGLVRTADMVRMLL
jgi:hypothetical protein